MDGCSIPDILRRSFCTKVTFWQNPGFYMVRNFTKIIKFDATLSTRDWKFERKSYIKLKNISTRALQLKWESDRFFGRFGGVKRPSRTCLGRLSPLPNTTGPKHYVLCCSRFLRLLARKRFQQTQRAQHRSPAPHTQQSLCTYGQGVLWRNPNTGKGLPRFETRLRAFSKGPKLQVRLRITSGPTSYKLECELQMLSKIAVS